MKAMIKTDVNNFKKKYLIVKSDDYTILISKYDSDEKYIFEKSSKIIIDNIDKPKKEVIKILKEKYHVEDNILAKDYDRFISDLKNLNHNNKSTKNITGKKLNKILGAKLINSCTIEITNICPFYCDHCYVEKCQNVNMSFEMFKKIIDELKSIKCFQILITGGEPLVNPFFKQMYLYAKENGFMISINSNGFLIDNYIDLFSKFKPSIIEISLYGYDDESYYDFTHKEKAFTKINNNIKTLLNNNINVSLKTVLTKKNKNYIAKLKTYADNLKLPFRYDYIIFPKVNGKKMKRNGESLKPSEIVRILRKDNEAVEYFEKAVRKTLELKNENNNIEKIFQCSLGKDRIFIDCNGNIKPCLVVEEKFNINEYCIKDAIKKIKKVVCKLEFSTNSKCQNCYKRNICRYCPGRFKQETGSYEMAPSYYCELGEKIIDEFNVNKNIRFELYDNKNKVPYKRYKEMLEIIIPFYNKLLNKNYNSPELYKPWVRMIRNTKDFYVLVCLNKDRVIGFINFMYQDIGLMLSEVQIKEQYQSKHGIFKKMMREVILKSDRSKYQSIYATINPKNQKSKSVFTHIGFKNIDNRLYSISYSDLIKWLEK
jgi:MoaA/NifB/PqqE/SkfB family radical SAM enzyme/L-amino acid N-acyltransferase YncA